MLTPVSAQSTPTPWPVPPMPRPAPLPRTMLLVEDSRFAAEAVRFLCRRAGIRLRRAETIASAQLHLAVYRPDIALIDLGLPDGSGLDLIAEMSQMRSGSQRIIATSGDDSLAKDARKAGADDFLLKPISLITHFETLTGLSPETTWGETAPLMKAQRVQNRDRQGGKDPLALRDDLRMICDLLNGPENELRTRYAGQLLASIGHSLGDPTLAQAATRAAQNSDRKQLVTLAQLHTEDGTQLVRS